jgi:tetratricopeptide (TPR) repeat protein
VSIDDRVASIPQDLADAVRESELPQAATLAKAIQALASGDIAAYERKLDRLAPSAELSAVIELARAEGQRIGGDEEGARARYAALLARAPRLPWSIWPILVRGAIAAGDPHTPRSIARLLEDQAEAAPDEPGVYLARAELFRARGQLENAINEYDYAAELDEDRIEAWLGQADCYLLQERPDEAAEALDHAVDADPNGIALFLRMGRAWLAAGNPGEAIRSFEEGLELAPDDAALLLGRAQAAMEMDLAGDALADCLKATSSDPHNPVAWEMLARAHYLLGQTTEALEAVERCVAGDGAPAAAWTLRGDLAWDRGDLIGARGFYERALTLAPDDTEAGLSIADLLIELEDHEGALARLNQLIAADVAPAAAHALMARALAATGDTPGAIDSLDTAVERLPDEPELYRMRAEIMRGAGRRNLAWRDLRWALDIDPGYASAYVLRAELALEMESAEEALADLDAAIEADPDDAEAYAWRGRAHQILGRSADAAADWSEAESLLAPDDPLMVSIAHWRAER